MLAPFPATRIIPGKSWGGVNLGEVDSDRAQAAARICGSDESYLRYGKGDDTYGD